MALKVKLRTEDEVREEARLILINISIQVI